VPGEGPMDAIFDLAQVHAQPSAEKILSLILDTSVVQECVRPVTVITAPDLLGESEPPDSSIRMIIIEFRGNRRALLGKDKLEVDIQVPVPLTDVLLRRDTEGTYSFRQTVVYKSNRQVVDPAWRQSDQGLLFVPVSTP
jgi:hypothetical protein